MSQTCSFCGKQSVEETKVSDLDLRICTNCHCTFLPGSKLNGVYRELERDARKQWLAIMIKDAESFSENGTPKCIRHKQELRKGTIPGYGFQGWVADCCDELHLPPADMVKILEIGIGHQAEYKHSGRYKEKPHFFKFLGAPLFWLYSKLSSDEVEEDPFEGVQYSLKLKRFLEVEDKE